MIPTGKGYFLWQISRCGTPKYIADLALSAKLNHVFIKIADGKADFNIVNGVDLAKQLASELKVRGIEAWGWQYVYNYSPEAEANKAAERIEETGVVGFAIDAEAQCKNKPNEADIYCDTLRAEVGSNYPIGLSSYRFPSVHPELPWSVFRSHCDFDMPQVYWMMAHNPGSQLTRSYGEFKVMPMKLPYVATGATFREFGWQPTLNEVNEFMSVARGLEINWNMWEWYDARFILPIDIWNAVAAWDMQPVPQPEPIVPLKYAIINTTALNMRSLPDATSLDIGTLKSGDDIPILEERNGWYRIEGWISSAYTKPK